MTMQYFKTGNQGLISRDEVVASRVRVIASQEVVGQEKIPITKEQFEQIEIDRIELERASLESRMSQFETKMAEKMLAAQKLAQFAGLTNEEMDLLFNLKSSK